MSKTQTQCLIVYAIRIWTIEYCPSTWLGVVSMSNHFEFRASDFEFLHKRKTIFWLRACAPLQRFPLNFSWAQCSGSPLSSPSKHLLQEMHLARCRSLFFQWLMIPGSLMSGLLRETKSASWFWITCSMRSRVLRPPTIMTGTLTLCRMSLHQSLK